MSDQRQRAADIAAAGGWKILTNDEVDRAVQADIRAHPAHQIPDPDCCVCVWAWVMTEDA